MRLADIFGPGSIPWLMRHDILLGHRNMRASSKRAGRVALSILGVLVILLHVAGFLAAPTLAAMHGEFRAESMMVGFVVLVSVFALFMSKSISHAADTLFDKGDLDLLLSSPLPMRRVLTTRLLAIAVISAVMPILVALPVVNGMVLRGHLEWVGIYPVVASLSIIAASIGSAMTFGLLAWVGPERAAVGARVLATLMGVVALLVAQIQFLVPNLTRSETWLALAAQARDGAHGLVWWPTRALLGEPLPMLVLVAASVGILVFVSAMLGRAYAYGVLGSSVSAGSNQAAELPRGPGDGPFRTLLRKEALLMVRRPGFTSNLLYQFVFLVPGVIMAKRLGEAASADIHAGVALLVVMMTGRIARIAAAGPFNSDEAAALAETSPISAHSVIRAKLVVTTSLLAAIVGVSLLVVWYEMPDALLATAIAATATVAARLWLAAGQERSMRRVGLHGRFANDATALPGFMFDLFWGLVGMTLAFAL